MRAKREFDTFDEAEEHFKGAQNALHIYLKELSRIPEVKKFIESNSEQRKLSKDLTIKKPPQFKLAEQYRNTHYRFLFLGHLNPEPRREKIGKTRVEEIVDFSRDRKKRLSHAEDFLDASRKSLKESEIFLPEKVELFLPTDDRTRNLLLKYKGYRISDWI